MMPDMWGPPSAAEISAAENENARLSKRVKELEAQNAELSGKIGQLESQNRCLRENKESCEKRMIDLAQHIPRWISVEEKGPVFPCVVYDGHNPPYTPSCGIVMLEDHDGKKQWIPDLPLEAVLKGELPKFCRLPVTHWMPLPSTEGIK